MSLFLLSVIPLACTTSQEETGSNPAENDSAADTATDTLPDATTTYYFGTSDGQTPDGSYDPEAKEILFIRTVTPEANSIREEFWQEGERRNEWTTGEFTNEVNAEASPNPTFGTTWVTDDGELVISGEFTEGQPWLWTAWHSTSTYVSGTWEGTLVTSDDQLDEIGADTADKHVFNAEGTETYQITEIITPTSEEAFTARLAEIQG